MRDETPEYAVLFNHYGESVGTISVHEAMVEAAIGEAPEVKIRGRLESQTIAGYRMKTTPPRSLTPKTVIFNPPATIVLWEDGTKTVVKCDRRDGYVPITGLALCYMKKSLGNTSRELNKSLREAEREWKGKKEK